MIKHLNKIKQSSDLFIKSKPVFLLFFILVLSVILLSGCAVHKVTRSIVTPDKIQTLDQKSPFLKVHMKNGNVYILEQWTVIENNKAVSGSGQLLNTNREGIKTGAFVVSIDSVAIFETNVTTMSGSVAAMAVMTGVSVGLTIVCISNPKTCFGSCPTFYASDGDKELIQAEGFSSSIAPSLEKTDIDALYRVQPSARDFRLTMKNEALETHVLQFTNLLIAKHQPDTRIVKDNIGGFWEVSHITPVQSCMASEGDISTFTREFDNLERFSKADSVDLGTKETIDVAFNPREGKNVCLIVGARQTFLSTFLFYQLLAYMGSRAGDFFTKLESGNQSARKIAGSMGDELGWIDVSAQAPNGSSVYLGRVGETGPLAADLWMIQIPDSLAKTGKITLSMTKGSWRLNYLAIADIVTEVTPTRVQASAVYRQGKRDDSALLQLRDSTEYLVTMPGDEYQICYSLPEDYNSYEIFLESRGYYMEWMRQEWLAEEDFGKAVSLLMNPKKGLQDLAPEFKKYEPEIEQMFWNSRYVR